MAKRSGELVDMHIFRPDDLVKRINFAENWGVVVANIVHCVDRCNHTIDDNIICSQNVWIVQPNIRS